MLRSKTRSGSTVDITQKNNYSSVFSKTLSASKLCRGDAIGTQIDANAHKSLDKRPPKSENRADRIMSMQQQMGEMEEELRRGKERFNVSEVEKYQILDQLKEAKELAKEANMRANESLSPNKANELKMELENLKNLLATSWDESKTKDKKIDSLESELEKSRQLETDRNAYLDKVNTELRGLKEKENDTKALLYKNKKIIQVLEDELERRKNSESKMADFLALQTKQLESTKFELEESKIEITSLHEKFELLKNSSKEVKESRSKQNGDFSDEEIKSLKYKLQLAQEGENKASLRADSLLDEMEILKDERKSAIEAEEKSTKAMDDLALALKEVATESNQAKEKLKITQNELEQVRAESDHFKKIVRLTEEGYQTLLHEAKQEAELYKNTADRLRVEAEETLLALNGKEMGFVSCIKKAEEERASTQRENFKLSESLKAAENMTRAAREETYKLRDILKQAVNEANAAKAAAGIAQDENSSLQDALSDKEENLHFLTREIERLRMSEAVLNENVKQLKRMLSRASMDFKESNKELIEENENKNINKNFSFNLEDLKFMNEPDQEYVLHDDKVLDDDPIKADALKGSIFDVNAETPKSEPRTPKSAFSKQKRYSSDDGGTPKKSEDFENFDDSDSDKGSHRRLKTMFQRVGDLLTIRRNLHRKEHSVEQTVTTQP